MLERVFIGCLLCLNFVACAPVTEQASQVGRQFGQALTGSQTLSYKTTAWDIVSTLAGIAFQLQPSQGHTIMFADNLTDQSLTLSAKVASGSATIATLGSAKPISVQVDCQEQEGGVNVTLTPSPAGDEIARATINKITAKLDERFDRLK